MSPEIRITIKVLCCYRCHHLWERRREASDLPMVCPACNSPYWNSRPKGKSEEREKLPPLRFHDQEVLESDFEEVLAKEQESRKK